MNIAVIGTGYVGLVTGTCLAETGNNIYCVDIDVKKIQKLQSGEITIYEPGLEKIFKRNIIEKRLTFTTKIEDVIDKVELIFLALPTPPKEDGSADLKYILQVANKLGTILKSYKIIINKSTVPIGTVDLVRNEIAKKYTGDFDVISNPEFLKEGDAVDDFMKPDRIVIGTDSERAKILMSKLYEPFVRQGNPIIFMDAKSAELTKYAANAFLATKISFMNEIAQICDKTGANVDNVRKGISFDDRIGKRFLFSGIGYGGSCFPKDVQALMYKSNEVNYDFKILNAVHTVNENQKLYLLEKINAHFDNNLAGLKFAIWGLSFKPNTDDIREAPAIKLIEKLLANKVTVAVFDPEAMDNVKIDFPNIEYGQNQYDILQDVDALIIATEWNEFRTPNYELMLSKIKNKLIFDGRNVYNPNQMMELGFTYYSIGRPLNF
ncbi:MAG: UDP-glucose/GDP-mannose dehydrogenase family protein [Sediminibacterium sp.]|nr:UDP-glucose/GDP-mannose dehydrogenase family protein [Sediminibacterium sp.]